MSGRHLGSHCEEPHSLLHCVILCLTVLYCVTLCYTVSHCEEPHSDRFSSTQSTLLCSISEVVCSRVQCKACRFYCVVFSVQHVARVESLQLCSVYKTMCTLNEQFPPPFPLVSLYTDNSDFTLFPSSHVLFKWKHVLLV